MRFWLVVGVWLTGVLVTLQDDEEDGFGDEFMVAELPGQEEQNQFRPRTAKEAMKLAARLADKMRSDEGQSYALLHDTAIGEAQRVAVVDVVDVTTSRYNNPRSRGFRKFAGTEAPRQGTEGTAAPPRTWFRQGSALGGRPRHYRPQERNRFRSLRKRKKTREKRDVDQSENVAGDFTLPPMSNEWDIKKKKKKKKKKKPVTDEPARTIQKKSKKFRIYLESEELALGKKNTKKGKDEPPDVVRGLSKELDNLFKNMDEPEEYTSPPLAMPTKAKFVPIPKNWQCPPSWKPPTRTPSRTFQRGRRRYSGIVTIAPEPIETSQEKVPVQQQGEERTLRRGEETTEFDWKKYDHPLKPQEPEEDRLVLKPGPEDWPSPTHPADGIYDWHKSQFRRSPRTWRPMYQSHTYSRHSNNLYSQMRWTQWPTYSSSWSRNKFSRGPRRFAKGFIPYTHQTTTPWSWAKAAQEETAMFRRNDMWQTKLYIRSTLPPPKPTRTWMQNIQPLLPSTWPTVGTKSAFYINPPDGEAQTELDINEVYYSQTQKGRWQPESQNLRDRKASIRNLGQFSDNTHLTTGSPLTTIGEGLDLTFTQQDGNVNANQEKLDQNDYHHQQYNYQYSPGQAAWQGSSQGRQTSHQAQVQYQHHQQSFSCNYTNYYNQYYQNYYSELVNKTAAYHYEQSHHVQDKDQVAGYYHSQYHYHSPAFQQSRLRPPAYFYTALDEVSSTIDPIEEVTAFIPNHLMPTLEVPYRLPNEYAGNDRDLRAPLPSRSWASSRLRPIGPLRRRFQVRGRKRQGGRPTVYRSIFTAPLQRAQWNSTHPNRPRVVPITTRPL